MNIAIINFSFSVYQGDAGGQGFPGVFGLYGPKVCAPFKLHAKPK